MIDTSETMRKYAEHQNAVNPVIPEDGDYIDGDGLIICGKCGRKKQTWIRIEGERIKVPCVCDCRQKEFDEQEQRFKEQENRRAMQRLRSASLMSGKFSAASFDAYYRRPENERAFRIARNYAGQFSQMAARNQGILFYGPVGTGKSYTAACIANDLLNRGVSVIMTSFVKLLQDFRDNETETAFLQMLDRVSLVIIDDLGAERDTDYALEKVYNVIDSRVRANRPLILTTNLSRQCMENTTDIRCQRIYDRIFEVCYPVEIAGNSLRVNQAMARERQMKGLLEKESQ